MCLALAVLKHKAGEPAALHPVKSSVQTVRAPSAPSFAVGVSSRGSALRWLCSHWVLGEGWWCCREHPLCWRVQLLLPSV